MRTVFIGVILAAAVVVTAIVAYPFAAQPKITWEPAEIFVPVVRDSTVLKSLTFTSDQAVSDIRIEAVPEIARFVRIEPSTVAQLSAGRPNAIRVVVKTPVGAPPSGLYEGTIHIKSGNITLPLPLPFTIQQLPPIGPQGGTLSLRTGVSFSLQPGSLSSETDFLVTPVSQGDLEDIVPPEVPIYAGVDVKPIFQSGFTGPATREYRATIIVPLYTSVPSGTILKVLQLNRLANNFADANANATVSPDGRTARFMTSRIGTLILVNSTHLGAENAE